jgi:hypothetical protein
VVELVVMEDTDKVQIALQDHNRAVVVILVDDPTVRQTINVLRVIVVDLVDVADTLERMVLVVVEVVLVMVDPQAQLFTDQAEDLIM